MNTPDNSSTAITRRPRRSAQQWANLIKTWELSGLTQEAFCEQHNLGLSNFCNWRQRVSQSAKPATQEPAFVELKPAELPRHDSTFCIELDLGSGMQLRITRT